MQIRLLKRRNGNGYFLVYPEENHQETNLNSI